MAFQEKNETFLLSYEIRVLILGIATFILALAAGFLFNGLLYGSFGGSPGASVFWVLTAAVFLLLVVMLGIDALLIKLNIVYLVFGASVLALILPVMARMNGWQWLAAVVLFLWISWSRWQIRRDLEIFVKPKAGRILTRGVKKMLSGLIIFISVFYFFSPGITQAENLFFSRSLFETVLVPLEKVVQGFLPQFRKDMTVDEAILEIAAGAAFDQALKSDPRLRETPSMEIENTRKQFFEQFKSRIPGERRELSEQLGVALKGDEKIADVFYDFTLAKFRELPAQARVFFNIFSALALYFILRLAAIPFGWLARIFAAGLFKILLIAGFISVKKEMIEREIARI